MSIDSTVAKVLDAIEAPIRWVLRKLLPGTFGGRRTTHAATHSDLLCDTCKYAYGDICRRPEKPNATSCPDYKKK